MIKLQASVSKGWLYDHGGFVFDNKYYTDPYYRMIQDQKCHEFIRERFPDYPIYNMEDNLVQAEYVVPNQMLVGAIQPNMIIAAALGAEFVYSPDKDSDIKGYPLKNIKNISDLPSAEAILELNFIKELDRTYDELKKKYPDYRLIPAFFWDTSGRGTIHGIITTSYKLIGEDVLLDMISEPELVDGIHQWITEVYSVVIKHFASKGNLRVNMIHVGECSGTMLSSDLYSRFVIPYINQLGRTFGGVRLHSCGNADHIIGPICEIENLKIIDIGSDTSLRPIREKMGKEFEINVFPPVEVLIKGSPLSRMENWLKKILDENQGGNLKVEYHLETGYDQKNCLYIHEELERLGLYKNERLY